MLEVGYPVWVVTDGDYDNIWHGIVGIFPTPKLDLAVALAIQVNGQVHPGAMSTEVNFDQRVNIRPDTLATTTGSS